MYDGMSESKKDSERERESEREGGREAGTVKRNCWIPEGTGSARFARASDGPRSSKRIGEIAP